MHEKKYIIELLPYSENCLLFDFFLRKRVLSLLSYLFKEMLVAIDNFHSGSFLNFDAHVGENLCQIRAVQLMDLSEQAHLNDINVSKNSITASMKQLSYIQEKDMGEIFNNESCQCVLSVFLDKLQLNAEISPIIYYLFLCHFLTRFRTFNALENTVIDYKRLIAEVKISKNLARKIVHEYQKKLSLESSEYVGRLVKNIKIEYMNSISFKKIREIDDDGRTVYPCFLVTDIILHKLMEMKLDIFCLIRTEFTSKKRLINMRFVFNDKKKCYEFSEEVPCVQGELPALIVHGITHRELNTESRLNEFIDFFKEKGIYQIIMAGMADHPQYSGKKLAAIKEVITIDFDNKTSSIINKFLEMKSFSKQFGCSGADARTFFIRHIFCDYISNQLKCFNQGLFYSSSTMAV